MTIHTHRGPKTVSSNIRILTFDAVVYRDARDSITNETGNIIKPVSDIMNALLNVTSVAVGESENADKPAVNAPRPRGQVQIQRSDPVAPQ